MNTAIYPIADNCEIHFTTDIVDRVISIVEYDTINETKTRLTSWSSGHWRYHNPTLHNKFDLLCRQMPELREALNKQMQYLRNPMDYQKDIVTVNEFFRTLSTKTQKTLKLFV